MWYLPTDRVIDVCAADSGVIAPGECVAVARRQLVARGRHALIVVAGRRPVGIVLWHDLARHAADDLIETVMDPRVPALPAAMLLADARQQVMRSAVDIDVFPVVNGDGMLERVIPREALLLVERQTTSATRPRAGASMPGTCAVPIHLERAMQVRDVTGSRVGTIAQIGLNSARQIAHVMVVSGHRHQARWLSAELIASVADTTVTLCIRRAELYRLSAHRPCGRSPRWPSRSACRRQPPLGVLHQELHGGLS